MGTTYKVVCELANEDCIAAVQYDDSLSRDPRCPFRLGLGERVPQ